MLNTKEAHIRRAKEKALRHLDSGKPKDAIASMAFDLAGHPETINHPDLPTLSKLALKHPMPIAEIRHCIQGFS